MSDVDFTTIMTPDDVAAVRHGGEIIRQHRSGEKLRTELDEAFAVGRGLLIGRVAAMRAANVSRPFGRPYVEAFAKWKREFGYDQTGEMPQAYFSNCLVIAEHREIAEAVLRETSEAERLGLGLSGLAQHTRHRILAAAVTAKPTAGSPPKPASATTAQAATTPLKPAPAPATASPVTQAADRAEVMTLRAELWRLRDKLDQLSIFLVEKPPPKAEDRPFVKTRAWPLPETLEQRPKYVGPPRIVDPPADITNDPAFALRKEEFEQWLVRRREELEREYTGRQNARGRVFTDDQFKRIWSCLHPDSRKSVSEATLAEAFRLFGSARDRLVFKDKRKGKG